MLCARDLGSASSRCRHWQTSHTPAGLPPSPPHDVPFLPTARLLLLPPPLPRPGTDPQTAHIHSRHALLSGLTLRLEEGDADPAAQAELDALAASLLGARYESLIGAAALPDGVTPQLAAEVFRWLRGAM